MIESVDLYVLLCKYVCIGPVLCKMYFVLCFTYYVRAMNYVRLRSGFILMLRSGVRAVGVVSLCSCWSRQPLFA